ncbi:MAG: hypothetical protein QXN15_05485 [Candidatus Jordarchaeales archaeon]|nr:hypothetical protein [Candidatus Jordarchaeia archaeon]
MILKHVEARILFLHGSLKPTTYLIKTCLRLPKGIQDAVTVVPVGEVLKLRQTEIMKKLVV